MSSVWINSLWFLSLVFSLAAAFLGILVKQWLRQYMKWSTSLGEPKETVLVRQIRFEAWSDWNVDAIISIVPALLELAVVLFLFGLIILLWTVQSTVAIIVTVAATLFLFFAAVFTVLPAFFKRCPYKSPTARAFAVLWGFCDRNLVALWRAAKCADINPILAAFSTTSTFDWKERELDDIPHWRLSEIFASDSTELQGHIRGGVDTKAVLLDMSKAETLLRALSWVALASQDERVTTNVVSSAESLHSTVLPFDIRYLSTLHILSVWNVSRSRSSMLDSMRPNATPQPSSSPHSLTRDISSLDSLLWRDYHSPETRVTDGRIQRVGGHLAAAPGQGFRFSETDMGDDREWSCTKLNFDIFARLLAGNIKCTVSELVRETNSLSASAEPLAIGCRVMGLLCALRRLVRAATAEWGTLAPSHYQNIYRPLVDAYNTLSMDRQADCIDENWCPGLRRAILSSICVYADVQFTSSGSLELGA